MAMSDKLQVNQQRANTTAGEPESFGIIQQRPKFPQYSVVAKRLESFNTWPEHIPFTPEVLAEAGLVYTGVGDSVRCFFCGGGLRNWEKGDNPWEEHARWYSACPHVLLMKGQHFIDRVKRGEHPVEDGPQQVVEESPSSQTDLMNTPAAQACLQMGFSTDQVTRAIDKYLQISGGSTSFKGKDIGEIIMDMED